jgi:hypothetical protein
MTESGEYWRRRLVTVAVRDYGYESADFAQRIDAQVAVLSEWLTDRALDGREFVHEPLNPQTRDNIDDFVKDAGLDSAGPDDVLVVYVTGHGIKGDSGRHFLVLADSDEDDPLATCCHTSNLLATVLSSKAEHVLIFVDSCYAGALHEEWAAVRKDLPKHRRDLETLNVIASADFDATPRIGEFAELLRLVYERLKGPAQLAGPYLTVAELFTEIHAVLDKHHQLGMPMLVWVPAPFHRDGTPCLPNPGYAAPVDLVERPRRQVAVTKSELDDYWTSRASGRVSAKDPGWYFSGRTELMEAVVQFLQSDDGILVVTGVAGSGKSAILARAVTLSDTLFRRDNPLVLAGVEASALPSEGCIDAAILARDKDSDQVCTELLEMLSGKRAGSDGAYDQLKAHLTGAAWPVLIVVDGVDEATYPDRLIAEVLGPLARIRGSAGKPLVRLLLGVRSEEDSPTTEDPSPGLLDLLRRAATLPSGPPVLRTDEKPAVTADVAAYLATLLGVSGPYVDDISAQDHVAQIVASRVSPSFLDARIAGEQLRDADNRQDLSDPEWLNTLADGTLSLFRADLTDTARLIGRPVAHVLAVLRATAFALGRGLPWADVWPATAAAVLDEPIDDADQVIDAVLHSRLAGYLAQNVEDGRIVHRPNHERLAEELRDNADALLDGGAG